MANHDEDVLAAMTRAMVSPWEEHRRFDTAQEAEAYAERLCAGIYADNNEISYQRPFRADLEGANWRVVGSRPYNWPITSFPLTGPLTIVFEKETGRVLDVHFTGAPAGWDAEIIRKADAARAQDEAARRDPEGRRDPEAK